MIHSSVCQEYRYELSVLTREDVFEIWLRELENKHFTHFMRGPLGRRDVTPFYTLRHQNKHVDTFVCDYPCICVHDLVNVMSTLHTVESMFQVVIISEDLKNKL